MSTFKTANTMFYNFNRHKEKPRMKHSCEAGTGKTKSAFTLAADQAFKKLGARWQRRLLFTGITIGCLSSAYLIGASILGWQASVDLNFSRQKFHAPARAAPTAQAHAAYLDSLEAAFLKDSINQSQLFQNPDADTNLLP